VAALAPHVLNAAKEGETVAQRAVDEAGTELAQLVKILTRHFPGTDTIRVATTGGLLRVGSPLLAALRTRLGTEIPRARLGDTSASVDAPIGALRLAAQLLEESAKHLQ
jgi:N-acetylglucosamine kinase-like BadF-type ATPase